MLVRRFVLAAVVIALAAGVAGAQTQTGTLTGVVTDEQGGVMPGVTVTIESPALLGGSRTTVTGETGTYQFVQLPPGLYAVTFELAGFNTVRMENIDVRVAFVGKVNATMNVAGVQETVTVTGESPVVDVKTTVTQTNIEAELIEAIPTGNNPWVMASMVPGMVTGVLDVGGNQGMQQYNLEIFGSDPGQKTFSIDGLKVNWPGGTGGSTMQYYDFAMYDEYNFQVAGQTAEVDVPGVFMNMVTKSGGNNFSNDNRFNFQNEDLQSNNVDDRVRAMGVKGGNPLKISYDWNSTVGGPIARDKAWFFGSIRWWRLDQYQLGAINPDGTQGIDDNRIRNYMGKVSWQPQVGDKVSFLYQFNDKQRFHRRNEPYLFVEDKAARHQENPTHNVLAQYNHVIGTNALVDLRFGRMWGSTIYHYRPEVDLENDVSIRDVVRYTMINSFEQDEENPLHRNQFNGSFSYFKDMAGGYHDLKFGAQVSDEKMRRIFWRIQDHYLELRDGVPLYAVLSNTPVDETELIKTWAAYAQDNWTIGQRLTLNLGVRFDGIQGAVPEQTSGAGTWVPERTFARKDDLPSWRNVAPRLGFSYDIFGDGKTAIKGGFGRYYVQIGDEIARQGNGNSLDNVRAVWTDLDGNGRLSPGPCGDRTCSPELGTIPVFAKALTSYDADAKRPYDDEFSLGFNHTLATDLALTVSYHRRQHPYGLGIRDRARPPEAYTPQPFTYQDPDKGATTVTVYSLDPALLRTGDRVITSVDFLESTYNGVNITLNKKFSNRWQLLGGITVSRHRGFLHNGLFTTSDFNDPNVLIGREDAAIHTDLPVQVNLAGSYLLPYDITFSFKYVGRSGTPNQRLLTVTGLTQAETIQVAPRGTDRADSITKFIDLRFAKTFSMGDVGTLEGTLDLFNLLNANHSVWEVESLGSRWGYPITILSPRVVRFGVKLSF